jgi:hypothetical protein
MIFMQMSATITEKFNFHYISTNIADKWQNKIYRPMLWRSATIIKLLLTWSHVSMTA